MDLLDNMDISDGDNITSDFLTPDPDIPLSAPELSQEHNLDATTYSENSSLDDNLNFDAPVSLCESDDVNFYGNDLSNSDFDKNNSYSTISTEEDYLSTGSIIEHIANPALTGLSTGSSEIDLDNFINIPDTDNIEILQKDIDSLHEKALGIEREDNNQDKQDISFGRRLCNSRGGCQGATDCDYSYGSYPG